MPHTRPHTCGVPGSFSLVRSLNAGAVVIASIVTAVGLPVAAFGQTPEETVDKLTPNRLLGDFIHYINIDDYKLAAGHGAELLARKVDPKEFVKLVETPKVGETDPVDRFSAAMDRAQKQADVAEIANQLVAQYEKGKLALARDHDQIAAAIKMLTGSDRGRVLGAERLKEAGEYAVPQLLKALLDNKGDAVLAAAAHEVLAAMGAKAVGPLSVAMMGLDGVGQERVAMVLGDIGYPGSLPYLAELRETTRNAAVRSACEQAMAKFGAAGQAPASELYLALAERYAMQSADVTSFPQDEFQLLWDYNAGVGLTMTAIRTPVYHEAMAMRCVERALELKTENPEAIALWVASNFKREIETPEGYQNPAYPAERKSAMYYAVACLYLILVGGLTGIPLAVTSITVHLSETSFVHTTCAPAAS